MTVMKLVTKWMGPGVALGALAALPALAQDGPIKAPDAAAMAGMVDKGDTAWMLVSTALVLMMSIPALALFYGGLVRTKNMLSLLMQVFMIVSLAALLWLFVGYSLAFTGGSPFVGGLSKAFLANVSTGSFAATFSNNVYIPEYAFVIFQMTFACITPALIVGAFAERIRFWPLMLFVAAWSVLVY
jgi:Amt family ammonium transporter